MGSRLDRDTFRDPLVRGEVPYAVLTPEGAERDLPLVLVLHGANSSRESLAALQPVADALWADGSLPPAVLACASTPTAGGFYLDHPGGDAWESLVAVALPRMLVRTRGVDPDRIALTGSSMGGYGALKIAAADPARWLAVAAVAPALLPARHPRDLRARNTVGVLAELGREMAGGDGDPRRYAADDVVDRVRANADAIRAAGLPILLRCGDRDVFALHDGTEQLHRALWDLDIGHEYHLVHDADHLGPEALAAQRAALAFLGAALHRRAGTDRTPADRDRQQRWQAWADGGRAGSPPELDATGPGGAHALRLLLGPQLDEAARRDPTTARRFGVLPPD